MAVENISDRASAYNMPGVLVDGQDVVAMYEAVREAVARARAGLGPSLIEGKTYRYREHAEGMSRIVREPYRTEEEIEEWKLRDPIIVHRDRLLSQQIATEAEIAGIEEAAHAAIEGALEFARESPYPDPEELFDDLYTNPIPIDRF